MDIVGKIKAIEKRLDDMTIIDTEDIRVTHSASGTELHIENCFGGGGLGATSSVPVTAPCLITGGNSSNGYSVTIYANGKGEASTGSGTIDVLEILWNDNIPAGTWVIGHETTTSATGGE